MIASPVFGLLGLLLCCGCCCAGLGVLARRASRNSAGDPPYDEVRDEEAAEPAAGQPASSGGGSGGDGGGGADGGGGQSSKDPASMSVRQLRSELSARGIAHEHCLEKSELAALLSHGSEESASPADAAPSIPAAPQTAGHPTAREEPPPSEVRNVPPPQRPPPREYELPPPSELPSPRTAASIVAADVEAPPEVPVADLLTPSEPPLSVAWAPGAVRVDDHTQVD